MFCHLFFKAFSCFAFLPFNGLSALLLACLKQCLYGTCCPGADGNPDSTSCLLGLYRLASTYTHLLIWILFICMCAHTWGVGCLCPPYRFQGWISGPQAWWSAPFLTEPSQLVFPLYLSRTFLILVWSRYLEVLAVLGGAACYSSSFRPCPTQACWLSLQSPTLCDTKLPTDSLWDFYVTSKYQLCPCDGMKSLPLSRVPQGTFPNPFRWWCFVFGFVFLP